MQDLGDVFKFLLFLVLIVGSIVTQVLKDRKARAARPPAPKPPREPEVIVFGGREFERGPRPEGRPEPRPAARRNPEEDLFRRMAEELGLPVGPPPRALKPPPPAGARPRPAGQAPAPVPAPRAPGLRPPAFPKLSGSSEARPPRPPSRARSVMASGRGGIRRAILAQEILGAPRALRGFDAAQ